MSSWLLFLLVVIGLALAAAVWLGRTPNPKRRVRPPPRSKKAEPSFQQANSLAKLFVEVLALKESSITWPTVLQRLNLEDEPHIRTLLLELRSERPASPGAVLDAIERVCIAAKREASTPSRAELLNRTLASLREPASP